MMRVHECVEKGPPVGIFESDEPKPMSKKKQRLETPGKLKSKEGKGEKQVHSEGRVQDQDPKRRLGKFQGTGEHARTGRRGE